MIRFTTAFLGLALLLGASPQENPATQDGNAPAESPWGIAPSHSASWGVGSWAPVIAETGIHWMRGFYQSEPDRVLPIAEKNGYQVGGISQTLQVSARAGQENAVLAHLFADADAQGSLALQGRMEPRLFEPLLGLSTSLQPASSRALVHARSSELSVALFSGNAMLSRLEGEWWCGFHTEPFDNVDDRQYIALLRSHTFAPTNQEKTGRQY